MVIECLLGKFLTLLQHEFVKMRQRRRIEAYRVFDQQNDLYPHTGSIVRRVHLVFNQFDDGQKQIRIAQPAKDVIDDA